MKSMTLKDWASKKVEKAQLAASNCLPLPSSLSHGQSYHKGHGKTDADEASVAPSRPTESFAARPRALYNLPLLPGTTPGLPFPSSVFLSVSFFCLCRQIGWSQLTGIVMMSDAMCTCAATRGRHMVQVRWVAIGMMACKEVVVVEEEEKEEEEEEEEEPTPYCTRRVHRMARATEMDRGKRMPIRRLSHRGFIQMLSLHIPVLSSASDHFLVQHANNLPSQSPNRIDTNSLPSQSPFSSLLLPLCLFFCLCLQQMTLCVRALLRGGAI
jgi:hypothetical protein